MTDSEIAIYTLILSGLSLIVIIIIECVRICVYRKKKKYKRKYKVMNDLCLMLNNEFRKIDNHLFTVMDKDEQGNPYIIFAKMIDLSETIINSYLLYISRTYNVDTEIQYNKGDFYLSIKFKKWIENKQ